MPHPFTDNAIISAFLHTGADWRTAAADLEGMSRHGEEYGDAAVRLRRLGQDHEDLQSGRISGAGLVERDNLRYEARNG